jgi:anti-anti-sigma factor
MEIQERSQEGAVILDLAGRLVTGDPQDALRDRLEELLAGGTRRIVLNLSQLARIDSSGIGELVAGVRLAQSVGGRIVILQLKDPVRRILDISNVLPVLETFDDEQSALDAFANDA